MSSIDGDQDNESLSDDHVENDGTLLAHSTKRKLDDPTANSGFHEREGRFYGPDSTWRFYTRDERADVAELDRNEADDLSIHLYNAHALKLRSRVPDGLADINFWHSKRRWIQPSDDGIDPFLPNRHWTAWPLRPSDVPRRYERWGNPTVCPADDAGTFFKKAFPGRGTDLQEELKALILRRASENFRQRQWESTEVQSGSSALYGSASTRTSKLEPASPSLVQSDDENSAYSNYSLGEKLTKPVADSAHRKAILPVFNADDEYTGALLQSNVTSIIAKLDDLFIGLGRSILGHRQWHADGSYSRSQSRARSHARGKSSSQQRLKRKRVASDAQSEPEHTDDGSPDGRRNVFDRARRSSRNLTGNHKRLNIRDWSEVLGVASILGWDQNVLDRTAARCANLFGESLDMRIMPEIRPGDTGDRSIHYKPDMLHGSIGTGDMEVPEIKSDAEGSQQSELCCPYESCRRYELPYEKRWRLNEHLKRAHHHIKEEAEDENDNENDIDDRVDEGDDEIERAPKPGKTEESSDEEDETRLEELHNIPTAPEKPPPPLYLRPITLEIPRWPGRKAAMKASATDGSGE